jgi:antitoxin YefM
MQAVNYSTLRSNLKEYCDRVAEDYETVIVTRKDEKNVVMISLEEYNNLMENLYIMSNKKNYDRLLKSKQQIEDHACVQKTTEELEDMEDE